MKKLLLLFLCLVSMSFRAQTLELQTFATGFSNPVAITHAGDERLFVVQRSGAIRIVNTNGSINSTPFLSLTSSTVLSGGERGLLGLAFHPDYATNGYFYVNYTRAGDGATVIARYSVSSANENIADNSSGQVILTISQPFNNHNGGSLVFGPDGYLYIGMGDGGSGGDPQNFAQNINSLLGKMLRIDVDVASGYGIPSDNPFVGIAGADEIWAVGMRNPWKFSFDSVTGDLWIADVGQNAREELNKVTSPLTAGLNFGWRCYEANLPYDTSGCLPASNYTMPVSTYNLGNGYCSSTGGYVYRGSTYPNMQGKYFFSDYCANRIGWVNNNGGTITWTTSFNGNFVSFGEDISGELYVVGISNGTISRLVDSSLSVTDFEKSGLTLYPNPASDFFTIKNTNQLSLKQVLIYDITGKIVKTQPLENVESTTISTSNLTAGMYFVTVEERNGNRLQTKLLVD
jgi:glucose/arabinose dehydrogenase